MVEDSHPARPPEGASVPPDPAPSAEAPGEDSAPAAGPAAEAPAKTPAADGEGAGGAEASTARPAKRPRDPAVARAFRTHRPLSGRVERAIKGGFEIRIGKSRGFCPYSQMDLHRVDDPEHYVGQTLFFNVIQFRRGGEDVVLSRRSLLEEERTEEAKAVRATLIEGAVTRGRVASVAAFGAFVDLGAGVTGLVHVSELSHARTPKPSEVVKPGDWVQVRVLRLDDARGRISLSIRQAQDDPWKQFAERFEAGRVYPGTVARVTDFGAFVELEPGIEVLAHSRDFPPSPEGFGNGVEPGAKAQWLLTTVDPERRRASVVPAPEDGSQPVVVRPQAGATMKGRVQKVERYGVFVWLGPGVVGLVPTPWTGTPKGTDLRRKFPVGRDVEVDVVEVEDDGRRIRLGVTGAPREAPAPRERGPRPERRGSRDADASAARISGSPTGTFGTSLGDALKEALGKNEDRV